MKAFKILTPVIALALSAGTALAQAPSTAPGTKSPAPQVPAAADAAAEAKFVLADKNKSGFVEGAELDPWKADLAKIDTNRDGKISKEEFVMATKAGTIK